MSITKLGQDIFLDNEENTGFSGSGVKTTFEDQESQEPQDEKYFTIGQLNLDSNLPLNFGLYYNQIHAIGKFANLDFGDPVWHPYTMSLHDFSEKFFPNKIYTQPIDWRVVPEKYESTDPTKVIMNQLFAISPWKFSNISHHPLRFTREISLNLTGTDIAFPRIWLGFQFLLTFNAGHMPTISEVLITSNFQIHETRETDDVYIFPIINMGEIQLNPDPTWQYFDAIKFIHTPIALELPNIKFDMPSDKSATISSIVDSKWAVSGDELNKLPWLDINFGPGVLLNLLNTVAIGTPINAAYSYLFSTYWLQEPTIPQEKK
jgi:hypothetical protein